MQTEIGKAICFKMKGATMCEQSLDDIFTAHEERKRKAVCDAEKESAEDISRRKLFCEFLMNVVFPQLEEMAQKISAKGYQADVECCEFDTAKPEISLVFNPEKGGRQKYVTPSTIIFRANQNNKLFVLPMIAGPNDREAKCIPGYHVPFDQEKVTKLFIEKHATLFIEKVLGLFEIPKR
jgi:hypothetical protein